MGSRLRAFSQIELLVAVGVLAVGLLAVFASLSYSVRAGKHSQAMSCAVALNRQIIDLIRSRQYDQDTPGLNDGPQTRRPVNARPFQNDIQVPEGVPDFTRNVQFERLSTDASRPESRLRRIRVSVFWSEQGAEREITLEAYQRL
ncbi:MAG: hypothetical protein AB1758_19810 [Candidatus Eremiobacterota bacterium]